MSKQTSAAQSAPAGEREAFELASVDDSFGSLRALGAEAERRGLENGDYIDFAARKAWEYFQAGAAWQRTQAAGVPDVSAMARVLSDRAASACCVDPDDNWKIYGQEYIEDVRAMLSAPAHPAERKEQHPDDAAVDRFAVAMKAKLAKSREKGRHGWQNASAAHLSSLLYRHVYKADPLDVANLAMMLHQNGQAIELPHEARHEQGDEVQRLREALERATKLLSAAAGYATKMEPMPAKLLNAIDAELDASTGQEV